MKKKLFRSKYRKNYSDFKVLTAEEMKDAKAEVIIKEEKPKRKKKVEK